MWNEYEEEKIKVLQLKISHNLEINQNSLCNDENSDLKVQVYQAMKNHYLMVQIADILRQLLENSSKMIKELNLGIKEISSKILESFRREHLTFEDISLLNQHIKIHDL